MALKAEVKSTDLMIGNWVEINGRLCQMTGKAIYDADENYISRRPIAPIYGIPLDESVLLKIEELIYDDNDERFKFEVGACEYVIEKQDDWYFIGVSLDGDTLFFVWDIYYLHTLQNVMSLLGQHLTFKP